MTPDVSRVLERIEELFALAPGENGGASRPAFSEAEARAMLLVAGWAGEAGLEAAVDPYGNLWCLPPGNAPCVTSGSHLDTVPDGGRYDGPLGTVLAVEAAMRVGGNRGVLVCAAEEASRFGAGTLGSRTMTGKLSDEDLSRLRDTAGRDALSARSGYLDALGDLPRLERAPLERISSHVEIHIEQRAERRDALCAAAEAVLLAEKLGRRYAPETTATAGTLNIRPNSLTSIPGAAEVGVDIRGVLPGVAQLLLEELLHGARETADRRGVCLEDQALSGSAPTEMDGGMVSAVEDVCTRQGVRCGRCVSFAGHDAQHLAAAVPAALVFVASENGVSHAPGEAIAGEDVEAALAVLCSLVKDLQRERTSQTLRGRR